MTSEYPYEEDGRIDTHKIMLNFFTMQQLIIIVIILLLLFTWSN